jgi:hypothetical protein
MTTLKELFQTMDEQVLKTEEDWIKEMSEGFRGDKPCYCLIGAECKATRIIYPNLRHEPDESPMRDEVSDLHADADAHMVNNLRASGKGQSIVDFNDAQSTTFADVKVFLKKCIETA